MTLVLSGLHRVVLVVHRGGRAGQVVDLVHLQHDGVDHVVADEFQVRPGHELPQVVLGAREVIIQADDFVVLFQEVFHQVRTDEPRPPGYQNPGHVAVSLVCGEIIHDILNGFRIKVNC